MGLTPATFHTEDIISIDRAEIERAIETAAKSPNGVFRVCLHGSPEAKLHQMLIVLPRGVYIRPKRHAAKTKSYHLIQGTMETIVFTDSGEIIQRIDLGDYNSGKPFCFRLAENIYHTVIPGSAPVVFHEITSGPFDRAEMDYAEWSPPETDTAAASAFLKKLARA